MVSRKVISICIPVMNEEASIEILVKTLNKLADQLDRFEFEFLFSDNNSTDGTWELLKKLQFHNLRIKGIRFSRNIGYQNSILQNYYTAKGDALIQYDADMQDPPEMIQEFIRFWEKGFDVVYGIRSARKGSKFDSLVRNIGYRALHWASDGLLHKNVGDFRLLDKKVILELKKREYVNPYLRGIVASLGFKEIGITYERHERKTGKSKFSSIQVVSMGVAGLLNYSTKPLKVFIPIAALLSCASILGIFWVFFLFFSNKPLPPGFSSTQAILFATMALNAFFFAILGQYVLKIFNALYPTKLAFVEDEIQPSI